MQSMVVVPNATTWLELTDAALPVGEVYEWCVRPNCGAVVLFGGVVRDHAMGRDNVTVLEYEAYAEMVEPKLAEIDEEIRRRWPDVERVAMLHRVGRLAVGESSVVVAASAPHRPAAFEAARFAIDALKESVPIWKREIWADGDDWGTGASELTSAADIASPGEGAQR